MEAANQTHGPHEVKISYHWIFFCVDIYKNIFFSQKISIYVLYGRTGSPVAAVALEILQRSWQEPKYRADNCKGNRVLTKTLWVGELVAMRPVSKPLLSQKLLRHFQWLCIRYTSNKMITLERSVFI